MLTSLALMLLVGLAAASVCRALRLPPMVGMLAAGILLGPHALNLLDGSILGISADLRQMALVIILIKAGLSLRPTDLKQVGRPALLMSFLPASFEIAAFVLLAPVVFGVSRLEAAIMGSVLGAVSPAVVVPRMVRLMEEGRGVGKGVPQLVLAGASLDDVFVIVLFGTFLGMAQGEGAAAGLVRVPASILLGIAGGILAGLALHLLFEARYMRGGAVRNSTKTIVILSAAFLLVALQGTLEHMVPFSGLLAVMAMACALRVRSPGPVAARLSEKFGKLWIAAEVLLFVLVGAAVEIRYTLAAGWRAMLMILLALVFRSAGAALCLLGTRLNAGERLFCVISYLPKATVQAAIGGVPLAAGLPCGRLVLSMAVLAIVLTAPLGAWGMGAFYRRLLRRD